MAPTIASLLRTPTLRYATYNIAARAVSAVAELIRWAAKKVSGLEVELVRPADADILRDPSLTGGMWDA